MVLFGLNKEQYMAKLKEDTTMRHKVKPGKICGVLAPPWTDDWDDQCGGEKCRREAGHDGEHMAFDGANGYHYWEEL